MTDLFITEEGKAEKEERFVTYIGPASYLVTKCRKPKEVQIPQKVRDLTFDRFYRNVIQKIDAAVKTSSEITTPKTVASVADGVSIAVAGTAVSYADKKDVD